MPTKAEKDSVTGTETTGHEWDGIKELNTPLPKWWLYVFYATIAFSLVYYVLYPTVPGFDGLVTVPVLYDKQRRMIVNNESSEIIRMLNHAFDQWARGDIDFYPEPLRKEIDAINGVVYDNVNNGVYRAGFATSQAAYDEAYDSLFSTLDELEARLSSQRYLVGGRITEADWRLFTTLVRFDAVYHGHFKCNRQRLTDYRNLWAYTRDLYQVPGVAKTINMDHIKTHYYGSHRSINPTGIVPKGPEVDFLAPHDRQ